MADRRESKAGKSADKDHASAGRAPVPGASGRVTAPAAPGKRKPARRSNPANSHKPAPISASTPVYAPTSDTLKDIPMAQPNHTDTFTKTISDAQEKAKSVFEKNASLFSEYTEFAKGNVEAFVEAGKIFTAGLQAIGSTMVNEGRTAVDTATSDIKALSAVKSPTDFFKLQGDIARRNFDTAVALGSRNSEALLKLASDTAAPLSGRISLAVEKVKTAA